MKAIKTTLLIIAALLVFTFGFLVGERYSNFRVPPGKELVKTAFLDSIKNLRPEIIVKDSIVFQDTIIYRDRDIPVPIEIRPEVNLYVDSIVNDSTHLIITDEIKGELINREVEYKRAVLLREIRTPYPVIVERDIEVYSPPWSVYGNITTGGNANVFMAGAGIGIITRKNLMIGAQVLTDFDNNYFGLSIGRKFDF